MLMATDQRTHGTIASSTPIHTCNRFLHWCFVMPAATGESRADHLPPPERVVAKISRTGARPPKKFAGAGYWEHRAPNHETHFQARRRRASFQICCAPRIIPERSASSHQHFRIPPSRNQPRKSRCVWRRANTGCPVPCGFIARGGCLRQVCGPRSASVISQSPRRFSRHPACLRFNDHSR